MGTDEGRALRRLRAGFLERADVIDVGVRQLLGRLEPARLEDERVLDVLMGVSRAADALRALARSDFGGADEATEAMGYYARRALG